MNQNIIIDRQLKCKLHPNRIVFLINLGQDSMSPSRFLCAQCYKEFKISNSEDFEDFGNFVSEGPRISSKGGPYELLQRYFTQIEMDFENLVTILQQKLIIFTEKLKKDLQEGIKRYSEWKNIVKEAKLQFQEAIGHKSFVENLDSMMQKENYHQTEDWVKLERMVTQMANEFQTQDNQEIMESLSKINTSLDMEFVDQKVLNNFMEVSITELDIFKRQMLSISQLANKPMKGFTNLIQEDFKQTILSRINKGHPTLIYQGSNVNLNYDDFWKSCSGIENPLLICKSQNGEVFGLYTPCKLLNNNQWQIDDTKSSFIFQGTKKQIYPLKNNQKHALYGFSQNSGYLLQVGSNGDFWICDNFQSGKSNLNQSYSTEGYTINNLSTHLFGDLSPNLIEMEVYQFN